MELDTITGSDFSAAASATASPESASVETAPLASDPATTGVVETTAPAAIPQATTTDPLVSEKPKGPIPFDVHSKALENARTKASEDALTKHREQFGWAETVDRQAIEQAQRIGQLYTTDRAGYLRQMLAEAIADPQLAPVIRSEAARILAGARSAQAPSLEPDIPVYDGEGQLVNQTFSAGKVRELIQHAVSEAVGPLKQDFEGRQQQARQQAIDQQLDRDVDKEIAYVEKRPHFKEHQKAIVQAYADHPGWTFREAYDHVLDTVILPTLSTAERKKTLADISQKPGASSMSPSNGTIAVPTPDEQKSWQELLREEAKAMGL